MNHLQNGNSGNQNPSFPSSPSLPTDGAPSNTQSPIPPNVNDLLDNNNGSRPGNYGPAPIRNFSQNLQHLAANVIDTVVGGTQKVVDSVGSIFSHFG